ncbi:MAG TPA: crossover junction endodeoxyribonuclease RuvC [Candidatus Nanoarchaeia archaeon]
MIILGIDPGTATTGWGIVRLKGNREQQTAKNKKNCPLSLVDFGCILTESKDEMGRRLLVIKRALQKIVKSHHPDCIVIEKLFFGANSTSALSVGQARGVVLLVAAENKLPTFEYTGLEVKLTVADHGRASKESIQSAVRRSLGIKRLPDPKDQTGRPVFRFRDDAYDAVAATICHVIKTASSKQTAEGARK